MIPFENGSSVSGNLCLELKYLLRAIYFHAEDNTYAHTLDCDYFIEKFGPPDKM